MVHRLYRLKNDDVSLPDCYQYVKSIKDQTNVGYDPIVAEFVDKWLSSVPLIDSSPLSIERKLGDGLYKQFAVSQRVRAISGVYSK